MTITIRLRLECNGKSSDTEVVVECDVEPDARMGFVSDVLQDMRRAVIDMPKPSTEETN